MEFNSTTFALEVLNFLVLMWLLQRLFYKPVSAAILKRKAAIEKTIADGEALRLEADKLRVLYEGRLDAWGREKEQAHSQLLKDIESERAQRMSALQANLESEQAKALTLVQRQQQEVQRRLEQNAREDGGRFVSALLTRLASAELEQRIIALFVEDLLQLGEGDLAVMRKAAQVDKAQITSAYPLDDRQKKDLVKAIQAASLQNIECVFCEDAVLLAGLRVSMGHWMLRANLLDELNYFTDAQHENFH